MEIFYDENKIIEILKGINTSLFCEKSQDIMKLVEHNNNIINSELLKKERDKIFLIIGKHYLEKKEYDKSLWNLYQAIKYAQENNNNSLLIEIGKNIFKIYREENQIEKAVQELKKTMELCKKTGSIDIYLSLMLELFRIYHFSMNHKEIIDLFEKSKASYSEEKHVLIYAKLYNVVGLAYEGLGNIEKAVECFEKSIDYFSKTNIDDEDATKPLNNMALIYGEYYENTSIAREYAMKVIENAKKNKNKKMIATAKYNMAVCYWLEDKYKTALEYYLDILKTYKNELNENLVVPYFNIFICYKEMGEYENAYQYIQKARQEIEDNPNIGKSKICLYINTASFFSEMGDFEFSEYYLSKAEKENTDQKMENVYNLIAKTMKVVNNYIKTGIFEQNIAKEIIDKHRTLKFYKERKEALQQFAEIYLESGNIEMAKQLLDESNTIKNNKNKKFLLTHYLYIQGRRIGKQKGLEMLIEAKKIAQELSFLPMLWKINESIGDCYINMGMSNEAMESYFNAMNILVELLDNVPYQYRNLYWGTNKRFSVLEKLLDLIINCDNDEFFRDKYTKFPEYIKSKMLFDIISQKDVLFHTQK